MFSVCFFIPPSVLCAYRIRLNLFEWPWFTCCGKGKDWLNGVQLGCGSLEGVKERETGREREKTWLSLWVRAPRGGGAGLRVAAPPSRCQQVESVIAVPGEGVRARTPITNHRLPAVGSWSRIVVLERKHWILPSSELPKSIHDSEIPPSPSGIFCVSGSELLYLLLRCLSRADHLIFFTEAGGLLLDFRDDFGSSWSISRVLEDSSSRPGISFYLWSAWIAFSGFRVSPHLPVVRAGTWADCRAELEESRSGLSSSDLFKAGFIKA